MEDLTAYTEVDPNARMTVTSSKANIVAADRKNDRVQLYKDFGVDSINDFRINFDVYINSSSETNGAIYCCCMTGAVVDWGSVSETDCIIQLEERPDSEGRISIQRAADIGMDYTLVDLNTVYYCTLYRKKYSDTVYLYIYSDELRTTLVDSLSVSGCGETTLYRYFMAISCLYGVSGAYEFTGYVQNIQWVPIGGGGAIMF